jgi:hypothetical protein
MRELTQKTGETQPQKKTKSYFSQRAIWEINLLEVNAKIWTESMWFSLMMVYIHNV